MNRLDYIAYACDMKDHCVSVNGNCGVCNSFVREVCHNIYGEHSPNKTAIVKLASLHRIHREGGK